MWTYAFVQPVCFPAWPIVLLGNNVAVHGKVYAKSDPFTPFFAKSAVYGSTGATQRGHKHEFTSGFFLLSM